MRIAIGLAGVAVITIVEVRTGAPFDTAQRALATGGLSASVGLAVKASDAQSPGGTRTRIDSLSYPLRDGSGKAMLRSIDVFAFRLLPVHGVTRRLYTAASTRHRSETQFWYRVPDRTPSDNGFLHTERLAPGRYSLEITAPGARHNTNRRPHPLTVLAASRS